MKTPHLLLAASNVRKLRENLLGIFSRAELAKLDLEIERNIRALFRLGDGHLKFGLSLSATAWRQKISRLYYGVYNMSRAIRLIEEGSYSTDSKDHARIEDLPATFPNLHQYKNKLKLLREDRNLADYDHSASETQLAISLFDAAAIAEGFRKDARAFIRGKGVHV